MKKLLSVFILVALVSSCVKEATPIDPVVSKYKYARVVFYNNDIVKDSTRIITTY